jgi:hypothetical protein
MQQGEAALGVEFERALEGFARELGVRLRAADPLEESILLPRLFDARGDDLLRKDVDAVAWVVDDVEVAGVHGAQQSCGGDEFFARKRKEPPFGDEAHRMSRASHALQQRRDVCRYADLDHELDVADVDAELEGGGGDQGAQFAGLEAALGVEAMFFGEAAVVAGDLAFAEFDGKARCEALGELAGVDEDQRRAVLVDECLDALVDLVPGFVGADIAQRGVGELEAEVELAEVPGVDRRYGARLSESILFALVALFAALCRARFARRHTAEKLSHARDRLLRRAQADALDGLLGERFEAFERNSQMRAALIANHRVDLVDDDRAHRAEDRATALGRQQQVERLRRRHQDLRRALDHALPRALRCVAAAHQHLDLGQRRSTRTQLFERPQQVALHVVAERLERRDVDDARLLRQLVAFGEERVDGRQERRERLAAARRSRDQRVLATLDRGPAGRLRRGGAAETFGKPLSDQRGEAGETQGALRARLALGRLLDAQHEPSAVEHARILVAAGLLHQRFDAGCHLLVV